MLYLSYNSTLGSYGSGFNLLEKGEDKNGLIRIVSAGVR